jgi:hypothetical protein
MVIEPPDSPSSLPPAIFVSDNSDRHVAGEPTKAHAYLSRVGIHYCKIAYSRKVISDGQKQARRW